MNEQQQAATTHHQRRGGHMKRRAWLAILLLVALALIGVVACASAPATGTRSPAPTRAQNLPTYGSPVFWDWYDDLVISFLSVYGNDARIAGFELGDP